jgi:hypothetical protein
MEVGTNERFLAAFDRKRLVGPPSGRKFRPLLILVWIFAANPLDREVDGRFLQGKESGVG